MIIRNACIVGGDHIGDIAIADGRIRAIGQDLPSDREESTIDAGGALLFPGLINSHDHLEFDCYPSLGRGPYDDYRAWGADIHRTFKDVIAEIERIPRELRMQWGIAKNLVCGVTAVAHHGERAGLPGDAAITIIDRGRPLHSVWHERAWRLQLNGIRNREPYTVHVGEGTDEHAQREIDQLLRWNLFRRTLIAVHGIAMTPAQAAQFAALVWCPESNRFLYGRTADVAQLTRCTSILFGTDSTISSDWNIWHHLREARSLGALDDAGLFDALTASPATTWGLHDRGRIVEGAAADIVLAHGNGATRWDAFFNIEPRDVLLVMRDGRIVLHDASLDAAVKLSERRFAFSVGGARKHAVIDVAGLRAAIAGIAPHAALPFGEA